MTTPDSQGGTRSPVHRFEWLAFVSLSLLICLAPAARQIFDVRSRHLPDWAMFANASLGQYRVQYFYQGEQGVVPVDRRSVLGLEDERPARLQLTRVRDIYSDGRRLCRKLRVKRLSANVHQSSDTGWERVKLKKSNLCRGSKKSKKSKK